MFIWLFLVNTLMKGLDRMLGDGVSQAEKKQAIGSAARKAARDLAVVSACAGALDVDNKIFNDAEMEVLRRATMVLVKVSNVINPIEKGDSS